MQAMRCDYAIPVIFVSPGGILDLLLVPKLLIATQTVSLGKRTIGLQSTSSPLLSSPLNSCKHLSDYPDLPQHKYLNWKRN